MIANLAPSNQNFQGISYCDRGSLIIGGYNNSIFDIYICNSLIVGGFSNEFYFSSLSKQSDNSVILGSNYSRMTVNGQNNFLSGFGKYSKTGFLYKDSSNSFITGIQNKLDGSKASSNLSIGASHVYCTCYSQILSGYSNCISQSNNIPTVGNSILNGSNNKIEYSGYFNSIINGFGNKIQCNGGVVNYQSPLTYQNSIINGSGNKLFAGRLNSILTGKDNYIRSNFYTPAGQPSTYKWPTCLSSILTGRCNRITIGPNSAILNGYKNEMFISELQTPASPNNINCSDNNVIISGRFNKISWGANNISLFGDSGFINKSFLSTLAGPVNFNADGATSSNNNVVGGGGRLNKVSNSVIINAPSTKIYGSFSTSTYDTSSSNVVIGAFGANSIIQGTCEHNNNVMLVAGTSQIKYSNSSSIIGGHNNCIWTVGTGSVTSAVILSSNSSKMVAGDGSCILDSVIIGGTSSGMTHSYRSAIINSLNSRIEGGCLNTILNSRQSVIGKSFKGIPSTENCMVSIISSCKSYFCIPDTSMGNMKNSVIIGMTNSCFRSESNTTLIDRLHILGTVSTIVGASKFDGVWYSSKSFASISQIVVCNGIVVSIT